jgi:hypothetical protein
MRHFCLILGLLVWFAAAPALAATGEQDPPSAPEAASPGATDQQAPAPAATGQEPTAPDIAPEAAAPVQAMCGLLKSKQSFTFTAEVSSEQVYPNGQTVQLTRNVEMAIRRPDKLYARISGDDRDRVFIYDGKTVVVADLDRGVYAVVDAPPTIDATLDMLSDKYDIHAPLSDLLYADPCAVMLQTVRTGDCVGAHTAVGKTCDHLAFSQKDSDWQLWVEKGKAPLPRKLVINDKQVMGWPQFSAIFSQWDLNPRLPAGLFTFKPQQDARQIDFMPLVSGQGETTK